MKYSIRKNWISSFDLIKSNPIILLPFIIIAFFEGVVLELIYFSSRNPISVISGPIIKKFFGGGPLHYPGNIFLIPKLFYYSQIVMYVLFGVLLAAISVNIFKNLKTNLPLKRNALLNNGLKIYPSLLLYGIIAVFSLFLLKKADIFVFNKIMRLLSNHMPQLVNKIYMIGITLLLFLSNIILHSFLVLTIPLIVISKKPFIKAIWGSIYIGFRNFFKIFSLIFLPFLLYLPITMLKSGSAQIADKTFPEINICIVVIGIITALFIDCFIIICASQFLMDINKKGLK